jgi:hypothetical protein
MDVRPLHAERSFEQGLYSSAKLVKLSQRVQRGGIRILPTLCGQESFIQNGPSLFNGAGRGIEQ